MGVAAISTMAITSKDRKQAERLRQQAIGAFTEIDAPAIAAQKLDLEGIEYLGGYDPVLEQEIGQDPSAFDDMVTDPRLAEAQQQALETLSEMGEAGLTDMEKAQLGAIRRETAGGEQSRQQAILASLAARGMGGSGAELAASLSSSQAASERAARESENLAAMTQQRALQAISQGGSLAGSITRRTAPQGRHRHRRGTLQPLRHGHRARKRQGRRGQAGKAHPHRHHQRQHRGRGQSRRPGAGEMAHALALGPFPRSRRQAEPA